MNALSNSIDRASVVSPGNGGGAPPAPADAAPSSTTVACFAATVPCFRAGEEDDCGEQIECIHYRAPDYVIYSTRDRVRIQFSSDRSIAAVQFAKIADLLPLRDKLQYLSRAHDRQPCSDYRLQIAEAFRMGLEQEDGVRAQEILEAATRDAREKVARLGRLHSLIAAGVFSLAVLAAAIGYFSPEDAMDPLDLMLLSGVGGAMGGFLSIAIAIRKRSVAPQGDVWTNVADTSVRIMIAIISGAAVYLLLTSGFVGMPFEVSGTEANTVRTDDVDLGWRATLALGFVAGFLERLVPDLLGKRFEAAPAPADAAQ